MRKNRIWKVMGVVLLVAVFAGAAAGPIMSNVEQAKYTVVASQGNIEIRDYAPMIVAEIEVAGERGNAIKQGFRVIADYIFGNNAAAQKVSMTAPVIQQGEGNSWRVRFMMPEGHTMQTLPTPNNNGIKLHKITGNHVAAIRFSGIANANSLKEQTEILNAFIVEKKLRASSAPVFAFYNPPWTLPFLRRNEVMIELVKQ